ncbi:hypothetical protein SAMN05216188_13188 [Lentzea xinjiangensis]|uniref:Uncharacterized protein n=1 Tax=Lentzea xinjiangensis TaxID=402600 RepID=A0A1H9W9E3_9PSEU|nr:hypothetical protein [Lentzea xinjiangensis]SES30576.1 hypothetical protein SAMN05216188_13188 [Lentzea xinjiangensis]
MAFPDVEHYVPAAVREVLGQRLPGRSPEDLRTQTEECLKFLIIASGSEPMFIPLTREVDEVWHELILQTHFYAELCRALPGGAFIHHQTLGIGDYASGATNPDLLDEYMFWIPAYVSRFGEYTEERARYWSVVQYLRDKHGIPLDAINAAGRVPC